MNKKVLIGIGAGIVVLVAGIPGYQYMEYSSDETQQLIRNMRTINEKRQEQWEVCQRFSDYSMSEQTAFVECIEPIKTLGDEYITQFEQAVGLEHNIFFILSDSQSIHEEITALDEKVINKIDRMMDQLEKQNHAN